MNKIQWVFVVTFGLIGVVGCQSTFESTVSRPQPRSGNVHYRCTPTQSCWPKRADWERLREQVGGRLVRVRSHMEVCKSNPQGNACKKAVELAQNPFYLEEQPGATQTTGWLNAWKTSTSEYVISAETAADVAAGVNFAREHHLKLVIKGTGHDYLGRNTAPNSLLIWTHNMRKIDTTDNFVPSGCPADGKGSPAVTVGAGTRWLEAYKVVSVDKGRYVQGGGCTSVGVAGGFTQGGGFGSFSKKFGTGASGMLEVEVVTADGKIQTANACQNADLFWALRGGGGSTFGVVTKMTLMTHKLPNEFGLMQRNIVARDDIAFKELVEYFVGFYRDNLHNEHWGEQVKLKDLTMKVEMISQGLTKEQAAVVWGPFDDWIAAKGDAYEFKSTSFMIPARSLWNYDYMKEHHPELVTKDTRDGQPDFQYWWTSNQGEVSSYLNSYQGRYLPMSFFTKENAQQLVQMLFDASREVSVGLHFNKGQSGASSEAIERGRQTSMNPAVYDAAAFIIITSRSKGFRGIAGHEPDLVKGKAAAKKVTAAIDIFRRGMPDAGSYANEADYFEPNWQLSFWGTHYARLLQIKREVDPGGLFQCHHCVGSEY